MATTIDDSVRTIHGRPITRVGTRTGLGRWVEWQDEPARRVEKRVAPDGRIETVFEPGRKLVWDHVEPDPGVTWLRLMREMQTRPIDLRPPSEVHDALDRLKASGGPDAELLIGLLASRISVEPRQPAAVLRFDIGSAHVGYRPGRAMPEPHPRDYLTRHGLGDFGVHGRLADVELGDDERWCPPLFGVATQNAVALERGRGLVRSRFEHRTPRLDAYGRPDGGTRVADVEAVTLLDPGGNRSLVWDATDTSVHV